MFDREKLVIPSLSKGNLNFTRYLWSIDRRFFRKLKNQKFANLVRKILATAEPPTHLYQHHSRKFTKQHNDKILTILSSNLCHDWPRHRRLKERLEAFARLAEEESADVILLQEVARTQQINVDEWLADRLGMSYLYVRANGNQEIGFEEGLAIFSRYPLRGSFVQQLSSPLPFVRRMALGTGVSTPNGNLLAFNVHLGLSSKNNAIQQTQLRSWITGLSAELPVLIGGDFNAHESSSQMLQTKFTWMDTFRHTHPGEEAHTHEFRWPWGGSFHRRRLDYIFLRDGIYPWRILETAHLLTRGLLHSDHQAVLARITPA